MVPHHDDPGRERDDAEKAAIRRFAGVAPSGRLPCDVDVLRRVDAVAWGCADPSDRRRAA